LSVLASKRSFRRFLARKRWVLIVPMGELFLDGVTIAPDPRS
jgi:hypothetical protein